MLDLKNLLPADGFQQTDKEKDFILIVGPQNSGKTTKLTELYQAQKDQYEKEEGLDAYFIDAIQPVSEWLNDPELVNYINISDTHGRRLSNTVKSKMMVNYFIDNQIIVFIDNLQKVTATKVPIVKAILERCPRVVMATTDEAHVSLSIRSYIDYYKPTIIKVNLPWFKPTFDITPMLYFAVIVGLLFLGQLGSAGIAATIAISALSDSWNKAKQT